MWIKVTALAVFIAVLFTATSVAAQQLPTQQYNRIFLDPFYLQELSGNTDYNFDFTLQPPDGSVSVKSAIISFRALNNPSLSYWLLVDGQACNPAEFFLSTSFANAGEHTFSFDCSNVITKEGTYTVTLRASENTGYTTGWVDVVYATVGQAGIQVHGTEYNRNLNEVAKVWLQLLDANNTDISNAFCSVDIYTPTNDEFIEGAAMTNIEHDGIYVYDIPISQFAVDGVWPAIARCYFDAEQTTEYADAFTLNWGDSEEGTFLLTTEIDGDEHKYRELTDADGKERLNFTYQLNDMCGFNISENLLSSISITTNQKWQSSVNDDITIHVYNHTSSTWIPLSNKIVTPNDRVTISNTVETNNLTKSGLVNANNTLLLFFNDSNVTDTADTKFEMDLLSVSCNQLANPEYQQVKGSSEIHLTSTEQYEIQIDYGNITNETLECCFDLHLTVGSNALVDQEDYETYFDIYAPFACHHILNVTVDGSPVSFYGQNPDDPYSGCRVTWFMNLSEDNTYDVVIEADKWFAHIENNWITGAKLQYDIVEIICENYQEANALPNYTYPINFDPKRYNDSFYAVCAQYIDTYIHLNNSYYNEFETVVAVLTEQQMAGLDNFWYHIEDGIDLLDNLGKNILAGMSTGADYSLAVLQDPYPPENPYYSTYWASLSSSYLNYQLTSAVPGRVWNTTYAPNRTLTQSFDVDLDPVLDSIDIANTSIHSRFDDVDAGIVSVNDTVLAVNSSLFAYIGSLFSDLTTQITNVPANVWSYTSRIVNITQTSIDSIVNPLNASITDINVSPVVVVNLEDNETFIINVTTEFNGTVNTTYIDNQTQVFNITVDYTDNQTITVEYIDNTTHNTSFNGSINFNPNITVNFTDNSTNLFNVSVDYTDNQSFEFVVNNSIFIDQNTTHQLIDIANSSIHQFLNEINTTVGDINVSPVVVVNLEDNETFVVNFTYIDNQSFEFVVNTSVFIDQNTTHELIDIANTSLHEALVGINQSIDALNVSPTININNTIEFNPNVTAYFNGTVNTTYIDNQTINVQYIDNTSHNVTFNGTLENNIFIDLNETQELIISANNSVHEALVGINQSIDDINLSEVTELVNLVNESLSQSIFDSFNSLSSQISSIPSDVWSWTNRTLSSWSFESQIWDYFNRTLTQDFNVNPVVNVSVQFNGTINVTVNDTTDLSSIISNLSSMNTTLSQKIDSVNDSISTNIYNIPSAVWSHNTRTLTEINATIIGGNVTAVVDPELIWSYSNRSLTEFCEGGSSVGKCVWLYQWYSGGWE